MVMGSCDVGTQGGALQRVGVGHALIVVIGLAVICVSAARSADIAAPSPGLRMPDPLLSLRDMYPDLATLPAAHEYTREFQPRADAARLPDTVAARAFKGADLPQTSAWQRLSDFRSDTGIRLLTLWRAATGTVAVHQGKHGGTSLQWTSQVFSSGSASRGLLDQLVSSVREAHAPLRLPAATGASFREPLAARAGSP